MAVYSKSELSAANGVVAILEQDASDAVGLITLLEGFKNQSTSRLKGDSWNIVRESLDGYIVALTARKNNATALASAIKSVNNEMIASLGDYPSIDTADYDATSTLFNKCNEILNGDNSNISAEDKEKYNSDIMRVAEKMLNQIKMVKTAESSGLGKLNTLLDGNQDFNNKTDSITSSSILYTTQI